GRALLVAGAALLWFFAAAYSVILLRAASLDAPMTLDWDRFHVQALHAGLVPAGLIFAMASAWCERRLENAPEFPLGLLSGLVSVVLTVALNGGVLLLAGETEWQVPVLVLVVLHLPVAVIEGVILGFAVGFLARVRPELLVPDHPRREAAPVAERV